MRSLVEQVRAEQLKQGWSTQKLLEKSGLDIDRSSLHRKLSGDVPSTTDECQAMAKALKLTLVWPSRGAA